MSNFVEPDQHTYQSTYQQNMEIKNSFDLAGIIKERQRLRQMGKNSSLTLGGEGHSSMKHDYLTLNNKVFINDVSLKADHAIEDL